MIGIISKTNMCWHIKSDDYFDERFTNNGIPIDRSQWNNLNSNMIGESYHFNVIDVEINPIILENGFSTNSTIIARLEGPDL